MGALGLTCCWMTVLGPATESNTYILVAPALAWVVLESFLSRRPRWFRALAVASWALFAAAQMAAWFPHSAEFRIMGPHVVAGLLLTACLVVAVLSTSPSASASPPRPLPGR